MYIYLVRLRSSHIMPAVRQYSGYRECRVPRATSQNRRPYLHNALVCGGQYIVRRRDIPISPLVILECSFLGGYPFIYLLLRSISFFSSSLQLSSSTRRRFYPRRPHGQAVVTGVVPSPPRYVPSIFIAHRVQHSQCSSIFIECC